MYQYFISLYCQIIFHHVSIQYFIYIFLSWWIFGLFLLLFSRFIWCVFVCVHLCVHAYGSQWAVVLSFYLGVLWIKLKSLAITCILWTVSIDFYFLFIMDNTLWIMLWMFVQFFVKMCAFCFFGYVCRSSIAWSYSIDSCLALWGFQIIFQSHCNFISSLRGF